jgi:hypothetical protein
MLRQRHQYRILTAAFLFALIGVAFFAGYLGTRLQDERIIQSSKTPPQKTERDNNEPESLWIRATTDPVAIATLMLAVATFWMGCGVYRQVAIGRDAIDLGNREFAATHRPRLKIAYIRLGTLQPGQPAIAEIWVINIGDGDAEITQLGADIFIRRIDRAGTAFFGATPAAYTDIEPVAPGQQANITIRGSRVLRQEEIDGINGSPNIGRDPWLHLCAVGTVHYLDANRTHRLTSFFRIYNRNRLRFVRPPDDDQYAEWDYEA